MMSPNIMPPVHGLFTTASRPPVTRPERLGTATGLEVLTRSPGTATFTGPGACRAASSVECPRCGSSTTNSKVNGVTYWYCTGRGCNWNSEP